MDAHTATDVPIELGGQATDGRSLRLVARFAIRSASPTLAAISSIVLTCCATPVVASNGHLGFGLFIIQTDQLDHGVVRHSISGVGLLVGAGTASLGYTERGWIDAPVQDHHYTIALPEVDLYVGRPAVQLAEELESVETAGPNALGEGRMDDSFLALATAVGTEGTAR